eukprot:GEMP01075519.1.p1 GENE.GEMP01075519.1~~GEMP01075519.1.p1  ORF type:complete len:241 (+),score=25.41 GEMP01075519.1:68-724(+)
MAPVAEMAAASTAMAMTSVLFNPLDVVKCRLQAQAALTNDVNKRLYIGTRHCFRTIYAQEGLWGLWSPGLTASIMRDVINGAIRMGMYPTVKNSLPWEGSGVAVKLCAGLITGAAGAFLGNPTDIIKIRFQTEAGRLVDGRYVTGLYQGNAPAHPHTLAAFVGLCKDGDLLRGAGTITQSRFSAMSWAKGRHCSCWPARYQDWWPRRSLRPWIWSKQG